MHPRRHHAHRLATYSLLLQGVRDRTFPALLAAVALSLVSPFLHTQGVESKLTLVGYFGLLAAGPLSWRYFSAAMSGHRPRLRLHWLVLGPVATLLAILRILEARVPLLAIVTDVLPPAICLSYLLFTQAQIIRHQTWSALGPFLLAYTLITALATAALPWSHNLSHVAAGSVCPVLIAQYLVGQRLPVFGDVFETSPSKGPRLKPERSRELGARVESAMTTERLYLLEDLSMPAFAAAIDATPHELSAYLNQVEGKSRFYRPCAWPLPGIPLLQLVAVGPFRMSAIITLHVRELVGEVDFWSRPKYCRSA